MNAGMPGRSGGSLPEESLVGLLTDESTPARALPLTIYDAVRILTRIHRSLLYGFPVHDEFDLLARLDAERSLLRLRSDLNGVVFGFEI